MGWFRLWRPCSSFGRIRCATVHKLSANGTDQCADRGGAGTGGGAVGAAHYARPAWPASGGPLHQPGQAGRAPTRVYSVPNPHLTPGATHPGLGRATAADTSTRSSGTGRAGGTASSRCSTFSGSFQCDLRTRYGGLCPRLHGSHPPAQCHVTLHQPGTGPSRSSLRPPVGASQHDSRQAALRLR